MVKKTIPQSLGFLSCLYGSCTTGSEKTACHLYLHVDIEKEEALNCLLQGFQCSKCDKFIKSEDEKNFRIIETPKMVKMEMDHHHDYSNLHSLYFHLLYDESSEETQLASVEVIRRILGHTAPDILIDQLDNPNLIVRIDASRLINRSCYSHVKGGFAMLLSRAAHIQNKLFDNLSGRLTSRPNVVREFAEVVLGVETEELVRKMVPVVLPKLLVYWQENAQAANTLNELAKLLDTDVVPLIVNWLPRVLAFALNQKEEKNLLLVLQLYHSQIGFDNKEIFSAVLPTLLGHDYCRSQGIQL